MTAVLNSAHAVPLSLSHLALILLCAVTVCVLMAVRWYGGIGAVWRVVRACGEWGWNCTYEGTQRLKRQHSASQRILE